MRTNKSRENGVQPAIREYMQILIISVDNQNSMANLTLNSKVRQWKDYKTAIGDAEYRMTIVKFIYSL